MPVLPREKYDTSGPHLQITPLAAPSSILTADKNRAESLNRHPRTPQLHAWSDRPVWKLVFRIDCFNFTKVIGPMRAINSVTGLKLLGCDGSRLRLLRLWTQEVQEAANKNEHSCRSEHGGYAYDDTFFN